MASLDSIRVDWIRPKSSTDLAMFKLCNSIEICGYVIPEGFESNGASVPSAFRGIFNPVGKAFPAAILHDYLLTLYSRAESDRAFRVALKSLGVGTGRRSLMYYAVRAYSFLKG